MSVSVLCDIACELGEGPSYDPHSDTLWWFDIVGRKLFSWQFGEAKLDVQELPFMASVLARIDDRHQLIATEDGLYARETDCGAFRLIKPLEADNEATRSNDGRVHPCGALWIGTMGKAHEQGAGAIYWFFKGELRKLYPGISIPNSICFSPDGAIAY
ncbi:MAG: SMP-30/gluconolactonase/LRE family protein, partial [Salaquimonas sp.]|nr:SMP-30/gluconolactonase/LRE family protein [Salaquimonas sp.]